MDIEKLRKRLEEDKNNPNGLFATLKKKQEIETKRFRKFEEWQKTNFFDHTFQKLLKKNGENRKEWCYERNCEKYPTPLMNFVLEYITKNIPNVYNSKFDGDFTAGTWYFKGYWFTLYIGQGSFWTIHDNNYNLVETV